MKYSVITFGCRVNQADSLRLEEDLRARGAAEAPSCDADLVVVNTCSVTATADQGARQTIRRIARENPRAQIVATGCYATRCPEQVSALPGVVHVVRNDEKLEFFAQAGVARNVSSADLFAQLTLRATEPGNGPCGKPIEPGLAGRTAYTLRVQTGCEERCSYCIIPSTRGASRSLPVPIVVSEVERVADAGFKEVALTGVHLGSYGRDLRPRTPLLDLLIALDGVSRDVRYRISSLEPMDCTPAIVEFVSRSGRFLPHFHLPLQHASDRILDAMRRPYTLDAYRRLVDDIRARLPHASIGADMIAGFPGETDEDFAANESYLPSSALTHLHVFPYSDRPGTAASQFSGRVSGVVVRDRAASLRAIGSELTRRFRDAQLQTVRPGLTLEDGTLVVTDNYLKLRIDPGLPRNTRVMVRVDRPDFATVVRARRKTKSASRAPGPATSDASTR